MLLVCPNPTIDHQIFLGEFEPGAVVRARTSRRLAGGKPVDVLRALGAFNLAPELLVFLPQHDRGYRELLAMEGREAEYVSVPGEMRETVVLYEDSGRATVVNGRGSELPPESWREAVSRILDLAVGKDWVIISGSLPPGVSGTDVRGLIDRLHDAGNRVSLDVGAAWLTDSIDACPDLITPNLAEAGLALGEGDGIETVDFADDALATAERYARDLHERGVARVAVTVGRLGTAWATENTSGVSEPFRADVVNPIGAGDAFLGGVMATLHEGGSFPHALYVGAATAAAAVSQWIPGQAERAVIDSFLREGIP